MNDPYEWIDRTIAAYQRERNEEQRLVDTQVRAAKEMWAAMTDYDRHRSTEAWDRLYGVFARYREVIK